MSEGVSVPPGSRPREGWFFEDYALGQRFGHATPRTITAGDAALYVALTGARQPAHCAEPVARALGHPACPVDDLLAFHVAFGKTVPDISYNAVANLGYAGLRFLEPVYAGDTLSAQSEVIGLRQNSSGTSGVVYVGSRALNQHGREVISWARWVMVAKRDPGAAAPAVSVPELPAADARPPARLAGLPLALLPALRPEQSMPLPQQLDAVPARVRQQTQRALAGFRRSAQAVRLRLPLSGPILPNRMA